MTINQHWDWREQSRRCNKHKKAPPIEPGPPVEEDVTSTTVEDDTISTLSEDETTSSEQDVI